MITHKGFKFDALVKAVIRVLVIAAVLNAGHVWLQKWSDKRVKIRINSPTRVGM